MTTSGSSSPISSLVTRSPEIPKLEERAFASMLGNHPPASRWIVASWNAAAPVGLSRRSAATIADDSNAGATSFRVMESLPGM